MRNSAVGAVSYRTTPDGGAATSSPSTSSPPCARRSASNASGITCEPPTGIGHPTACPSVASIRPAPAATNEGICEIVCAATPVNDALASPPASLPRPAALGQQAWRHTQCGRDARRKRALVAEQQPDDAVAVRGQRTEQAAPRVAVFELGAGAIDVAVADRGGSSRERVAVGHLGLGELHTAAWKIERGEERRSQRQRVHGGADVVGDPGELGVRQRSRTTPDGGLRFDDPHRQPSSGADDGGRQPVGAASHDGHVHWVIRAHYAGAS